MTVKNKVAVVTGATDGIGRHVARILTEKGARVIGTGRDPERLRTLAGEIDLALTMDVTDPAQIEVVRAAALDRHGGVDIVVNNAGVKRFTAWDATDDAAVRRIMEVNFFGAVAVARAFLPNLIQRKGVLAQVSSVAGRRGYANHTAYCASKYALNGWSASLREELRGTGADVVVVHPPAVDTNFFSNAGNPDFRANHAHLRLMSPETVAREIVTSVEERRHSVILTLRSRILDTMSFAAPGLLNLVQKIK
jgi:uncharacterized protein